MITPPKPKQIFSLCAWSILVYILLKPIITAPLVADDFLAPFTEYLANRGKWQSAVSHSIGIVRDGVSFRPVATLLNTAQNFLTVQVGLRFSISPTTVFSWLRFVTFLFLIDSISRLIADTLGNVAIFEKSRTRLGSIRILVTTLLAAVIQIHILWSNDPVTNYILSGLFPLGLMIHSIRFGMRATQSHKPRDYGLAAGLGLVAGLTYELTIGLAVGFVIATLLFVPRSPTQRFSRQHILAASTALPNLLVVSFGRIAYRKAANAYGGTTIGDQHSLAETALIHVAGQLPGTAWRLSHETNRLVFIPTVRAVLVGVIVGVSVLVCAKRIATSREPRNRLKLIFILTTGSLIPPVLLSLTAKVQNETTRFGEVYIPYAYGLPLSIVTLAVVSAWLTKKTRAMWALCIFLAAIGTVQYSINDRLSIHAQGAFRANSEILATWSDRPNRDARCLALSNWEQIPWPQYYRDELKNGLQMTYSDYFGEDFC